MKDLSHRGRGRGNPPQGFVTVRIDQLAPGDEVVLAGGKGTVVLAKVEVSRGGKTVKLQTVDGRKLKVLAEAGVNARLVPREYRVAYTRGDARRTHVDDDFTLAHAESEVRAIKRRGMSAWVEKRDGTFVPIRGVLRRPGFRPDGNPGQTVPIPWAPGFAVWRGRPTKAEIVHAPPFTVFVGAKSTQLPAADSTDALGGEPAFWVTERDDVPYDDEVAEVLRGSGLPWGRRDPPTDPDAALYSFPDANEELVGERVEVGGRSFVLEQEDALAWALDAGFTLLVVPDALRGKQAQYRMYYVVDDGHSDEHTYWWAQTPLHGEFAKLAHHSSAAGDLQVINAHRRRIGMHPLDPQAAGWSDDDVHVEAKRLRGNPRRRTGTAREANPLPPGIQATLAPDEYEPIERYEVKTGAYHMEIWEEQSDDQLLGVIVVTYTGPWGGGPSVRLEYDVEEEDEAARFDADRSARGDFDVRDMLARFGYDEYTNNPGSIDVNPHEDTMTPAQVDQLRREVLAFFHDHKHERMSLAKARRHFGRRWGLTRPIEVTLQAHGVVHRPPRRGVRWTYPQLPLAWHLAGDTLVPAREARGNPRAQLLDW